jgi:hypothetical protein
MGEEKIAIHCKTEEEFESVKKKNGFSPGKKYRNAGGEDPCWTMSGEFCYREFYEERGYTIIPASDYLKDEEFKVGDRVECIKPYTDTIQVGETGVVVEVRKHNIAIKWDKLGIENRHTCGNLCEDGYGYYVLKENVKKANQPKTTKKGASKMSEGKTVAIGSIFLEVFTNGKEAKKMSDRFGDQYGSNPDRDLIALQNDRSALVAIVKAEEAEKAKEEKSANSK